MWAFVSPLHIARAISSEFPASDRRPEVGQVSADARAVVTNEGVTTLYARLDPVTSYDCLRTVLFGRAFSWRRKKNHVAWTSRHDAFKTASDLVSSN